MYLEAVSKLGTIIIRVTTPGVVDLHINAFAVDTLVNSAVVRIVTVRISVAGWRGNLLALPGLGVAYLSRVAIRILLTPLHPRFTTYSVRRTLLPFGTVLVTRTSGNRSTMSANAFLAFRALRIGDA